MNLYRRTTLIAFRVSTVWYWFPLFTIWMIAYTIMRKNKVGRTLIAFADWCDRPLIYIESKITGDHK